MGIQGLGGFGDLSLFTLYIGPSDSVGRAELQLCSSGNTAASLGESEEESHLSETLEVLGQEHST